MTATIHATFVVERAYDASPERVFFALSDPDARRRWFMDAEGFTSITYEPDFRVGAREFFQFGVGPMNREMTNVHHIHDIIPNERIVLSYAMGWVGEPPFSASLATFELIPEGPGTRLRFTEQGAYLNDEADHALMREHGWKQILERLASEIAGHPQAA